MCCFVHYAQKNGYGSCHISSSQLTTTGVHLLTALSVQQPAFHLIKTLLYSFFHGMTNKSVMKLQSGPDLLQSCGIFPCNITCEIRCSNSLIKSLSHSAVLVLCRAKGIYFEIHKNVKWTKRNLDSWSKLWQMDHFQQKACIFLIGHEGRKTDKCELQKYYFYFGSKITSHPV